MGEVLAGVGVFAYEVELLNLDGLAVVGEGLGALIGDVPGAGQVGATASEAEGEEAFDFGLVSGFMEDGDLVDAGIEYLHRCRPGIE